MEHFSEAEAQRIFAEAARASAATPPEGGLSLDELREIGRAAGLDPDAVTAAAAALRDAPADVPMWGTTPLATRRSRTVAGRLSDDAWADAVSGLRREFKAQGVTETIGRARTWTYAVGPGSELLMARLTAEPVGESTRLTLESADMGEKRAAKLLGVILLGLGAVFTVAMGLELGAFAATIVALVALAAFAAALGGLRWAAARRARINTARFGVALDRVATLVAHRTEPGAPDLAPLLDLPDDETTSDPSASPTRRTRA